MSRNHTDPWITTDSDSAGHPIALQFHIKGMRLFLTLQKDLWVLYCPTMSDLGMMPMAAKHEVEKAKLWALRTIRIKLLSDINQQLTEMAKKMSLEETLEEMTGEH
jgi:hypothetical protein